jgi:hypothetical protein
MRHSHSILCALMALVLTPVPLQAHAEANSATGFEACNLGQPVRAMASLRDLPEPVRDALGFIADVGEPYNSTDFMVLGRPGRRFVTAIQAGDLYVIRYEQGGIFYSRWVAVYRLAAGANKPELVTRQNGLGSDPCRTIGDLLDGKKPR